MLYGKGCPFGFKRFAGFRSQADLEKYLGSSVVLINPGGQIVRLVTTHEILKQFKTRRLAQNGGVLMRALWLCCMFLSWLVVYAWTCSGLKVATIGFFQASISASSSLHLYPEGYRRNTESVSEPFLTPGSELPLILRGNMFIIYAILGRLASAGQHTPLFTWAANNQCIFSPTMS